MKKANRSPDGSENYRKLVLPKRSKVSYLRRRLDTQGVSEDRMPLARDLYIASQINYLEYLRLKLVQERIDCGAVGMCLACGCPIPLIRLQAIPWATSCANCQERLSPAD